MNNATLVRIEGIATEKLAARAAQLFRAWGDNKLANAAATKRRELRYKKARKSAYNHQ